MNKRLVERIFIEKPALAKSSVWLRMIDLNEKNNDERGLKMIKMREWGLTVFEL